MKKWMTLVFVSMFAVTLAMPAWSQTNGAKNQTATAQKKADQQAKKEADKKKKADKKEAAKKAKEAKKSTAKK